MKTTLKLMTLLFLLMTSIGRSHATTPSGNLSTDYCKDVTVKTGVHFLQVSGLIAPWSRVRYRKDGSSTYREICKDNCSTTHGISGISAGTYHVRIQQSDSDGTNHCIKEVTVKVKQKNNYCTDVRAVGGAEEISVSGVQAPWSRIQYRKYGFETYYDMCNDYCGNPQVQSEVAAGKYIVKIEQSDTDGTKYCVKEIFIQVKAKPRDYCKDASAEGGVEEITVSGVSAPWNRIQYRREGSYRAHDVCADDCGNPEVIKDVAAGKYVVKIEQSSGGNKDYCVKRITVTVAEKKIDYCGGVNITAHPGIITITGIHAPWNRVLLKGPSTNHKVITICDDDCYNPIYSNSQLVIKNLKNGNYTVVVEQSGAGHANYCKVEEVHYVKRSQSQHGKMIGEQSDLTANLYNPTKLTHQVIYDISLTDQELVATELIADNADLKANHNLDGKAITLFPNPAQSELNVTVASYAGQQADLVVVNQVGAVVEMMRIETLPESPLSIDVSAYTDGLYFLQVQVAGSDFITKKFVVRK